LSGSVLIVGKIPPPAGGVGVHVLRLLATLKANGREADFFDMRKVAWWRLPAYIFRCRIVHLHMSNSFVRLFVILLTRIMFRKVLFTFHGDVGRYSALRNSVDRLSIRLADRTIVLNQQSLSLANRISTRTKLVSAYIRPLETKPLDPTIKDRIEDWIEGCSTVFCTNANRFVKDKNDQEIYGIMPLIEIFEKHPSLGLIVSDASGEYARYLSDNDLSVSKNILIISAIHDSINVLNYSDCFVRATTTDGDSLSIREALDFNTNVIASDCVSRPEGCLVYDTLNFSALEKLISSFDRSSVVSSVGNGVGDILKIYDDMLT